mmetsp:Transcript_1371/g.1921  ORF Transcript_1371/g.1921 Transcript_1371/m.1921 type:complete len:249 (-) Transcript_1371:370-1116(-)
MEEVRAALVGMVQLPGIWDRSRRLGRGGLHARGRHGREGHGTGSPHPPRAPCIRESAAAGSEGRPASEHGDLDGGHHGGGELRCELAFASLRHARDGRDLRLELRRVVVLAGVAKLAHPRLDKERTDLAARADRKPARERVPVRDSLARRDRVLPQKLDRGAARGVVKAARLAELAPPVVHVVVALRIPRPHRQTGERMDDTGSWPAISSVLHLSLLVVLARVRSSLRHIVVRTLVVGRSRHARRLGI